MKRLLSFAVLMLLSPSAYAGDSFSFVVGGHRIHIEAPSHCDSPSCVSISIPGIYQTHGRDRYRDDTPEAAAKYVFGAATSQEFGQDITAIPDITRA